MERDLFWDMEKVTIYLGFTIVGLGIWNATGDATISPALVTGISASGLCITLADFLSKQYNNSNNKILIFIDNLLYILAIMCLLAYPNSNWITSLDESFLNSLSTTASLVALGFVFATIGFSNKKAMLAREKERLERIKEITEITQKVSQRDVEIDDRMMNLLTDMSVTIKDLEKEVNELKNKTEKSSV